MSVNFYDSTTGTLTRLDGLASEANIVHKSGTETVTGEKTFSGDVVATRIESTGTVTIGKRHNDAESAPTGGNLTVEGALTVGGVTLPYKEETIVVTLSSLTWTTSTTGKHYAPYSVSGFSHISMACINDFSALRATDIVQVGVAASVSPALLLLSNTNSFTTGASIYVKVLGY